MLKNFLLGTIPCLAPPRETGDGGDVGGDAGDNSVEKDILDGLELNDADFGSDDGQDDLGDDVGDDQIDADGAGLDNIGDPESRVSHTAKRGDGRQTERQPTPKLPARAEVKADGKGNLIDGTGKVVARAGKEARLYQEAHTARTQVGQIQGQLRQAGTKLSEAVRIATALLNENNGYKAQGEALKAFNLKPDELLEAARMFTDYRTEPLAALRKMLTRAAASGINIAELGQGVGGAVDAKSIADLIKQEMAPLRQNMTEQGERDRQAREADKQRADSESAVVSFFDANPDAKQYGQVFLHVMQTEEGRGLSLSHIWDKIRLNLLLNGGTQREDNTNPGRPNGRRAPDGRGSRRANVNEPASTSTSYEDIIKPLLGQLAR